jgi:hypothetical protein
MFHGSYLESDVIFLLKIATNMQEIDILKKEELIQSGKKHYSEMLSPEYEPSDEYLKVFYHSVNQNAKKLAKHILYLAKEINNQSDFSLVSLARAGTPIGVILKRVLKEFFDKDIPHYSISIIKDRGVDENAIKYIWSKHGENIVFIDGWTGKGSISAELKKNIEEFNQKNHCNITKKIYVVSDISGSADFCATNEDYLIPSSILNSTVSGLISRTVLSTDIDKNDFHSCKYYQEFEKKDLSIWFVDKIISEIKNLISVDKLDFENYFYENLNKTSKTFIEKIQKEFNIAKVDYIKPGICETTRVLLRRFPEKLLVKDIKSSEINHLLLLAQEKNIKVIEYKEMPYKAVGLISKVKKEI